MRYASLHTKQTMYCLDYDVEEISDIAASRRTMTASQHVDNTSCRPSAVFKSSSNCFRLVANLHRITDRSDNNV